MVKASSLGYRCLQLLIRGVVKNPTQDAQDWIHNCNTFSNTGLRGFINLLRHKNLRLLCGRYSDKSHKRKLETLYS